MSSMCHDAEPFDGHHCKFARASLQEWILHQYTPSSAVKWGVQAASSVGTDVRCVTRWRASAATKAPGRVSSWAENVTCHTWGQSS